MERNDTSHAKATDGQKSCYSGKEKCHTLKNVPLVNARMEKIMLNEKDKAFWQAPAWYHALSLTERLGSRQAETGDISSTNRETEDKAVSRFRAWKAQCPFEQGTLFAERLAGDSLSEEDLLSLLVEPMARVQARISAIPDWLAALMDAFTDAYAAEKTLPLSQKTRANQPLEGCL
jgi:hypothetical protein